jgi:DNA mismatch endonuclease (patch repair protein)
MGDNLTKEQRSYAMSRIRSRGNSSTEKALIAVMRKAGISGWRRKSVLCGKPDFVFPRFHTVVFVDGCYWHGCRKCCLSSKTNNEYWGPKIQGNAKRDRRNTKELRDAGWKVVRIWEHDLKAEPMKCIKKIMVAIGPDRD